MTLLRQRATLTDHQRNLKREKEVEARNPRPGTDVDHHKETSHHLVDRENESQKEPARLRTKRKERGILI